jgi:hypothetical protein
MNVISIDPKDKEQRKLKADLLEILDDIREQVEQGNIVELVAVSTCEDGEQQIHTLVSDLPTAVGLFEIGKHIALNYED